MRRIFYNVYTDPVPERDAEIQKALKLNRECKQIGEVVLLKGRPTFDAFFKKINEIAGPDDISCIINSDCYVEAETIEWVDLMEADEAYALSRWDVKAEGEPILFDRKDSSDAWVIRGKPRKVSAKFTTGIRGCDNALTAILHDAGYKVSNPSKTIKTYHLHLTNLRRYGNMPWQCVPKPYLLIPPHELGEAPELFYRPMVEPTAIWPKSIKELRLA